jgi:hypothetical protein
MAPSRTGPGDSHDDRFMHLGLFVVNAAQRVDGFVGGGRHVVAGLAVEFDD